MRSCVAVLECNVSSTAVSQLPDCRPVADEKVFHATCEEYNDRMLSNVSYVWHPHGYQFHRAHYSAMGLRGGGGEKERMWSAANARISRKLSPFHCSPPHTAKNLSLLTVLEKVLNIDIVDRVVVEGFRASTRQIILQFDLAWMVDLAWRCVCW